VFRVLLKKPSPTPVYNEQMYSLRVLVRRGATGEIEKIDASGLESIKKDPQSIVLAPGSEATHTVRNLLRPLLSQQSYNDVAAFAPKQKLCWIMQVHYLRCLRQQTFYQTLLHLLPLERRRSAFTAIFFDSY
jgi:hypothetical protein